jgi:uncharacterized RDD family membrane protein YckC
MDKEVWYYKMGEEKSGPLSYQELQGKLDRGEISASTEIWKEDFSEWLPISEVEHFNRATLDETPTITIEKKVDYERETDQEGVRPHPWIRFWARMIDYSLFVLVIMGFLGSFRSPFWWMVTIFLWALIEALLMATWGATPGKWVLKIRVRDEKEEKLSFSESLNRSLSVWFLGMGGGIPIVTLVTMIVAAVKLNSRGVTIWDRRGKLRVMHRKVGIIRVLIVILYFLCYVWAVSWGQFQMMNHS